MEKHSSKKILLDEKCGKLKEILGSFGETDEFSPEEEKVLLKHFEECNICQEEALVNPLEDFKISQEQKEEWEFEIFQSFSLSWFSDEKREEISESAKRIEENLRKRIEEETKIGKQPLQINSIQNQFNEFCKEKFKRVSCSSSSEKIYRGKSFDGKFAWSIERSKQALTFRFSTFLYELEGEKFILVIENIPQKEFTLEWIEDQLCAKVKIPLKKSDSFDLSTTRIELVNE